MRPSGGLEFTTVAVDFCSPVPTPIPTLQNQMTVRLSGRFELISMVGTRMLRVNTVAGGDSFTESDGKTGRERRIESPHSWAWLLRRWCSLEARLGWSHDRIEQIGESM